MKFLNLFFLLILSVTGVAQQVEMADQMRSEGKIYVVIAVLLAILIGLIVYLITIDRKVGKLEKELEKNN